MTIKYCDYIDGDDDTGDGTSGNPYQTITKASTGLTGGDEVRAAKSPAVSALSGTLAWVDGSALITTSEDLTGNIAAGDFVGKDTTGETWWEVVGITSNTLTLYQKYSGTTETVASKLLGITSTGEAAATGTEVQTVSASGSSAASRLKISGGWNLTGPTQDGQTYFRQMHGTFNNRYGQGLYISIRSFLEIERCHFLRYYYGIRLRTNSNNNIVTAPTCNSNFYGIYLYSTINNNTITTPTCNANTIYGIYIYICPNNAITTPTCNSNQHGIYIYRSPNSAITTPTCNNNSAYGIYLALSSNTVIAAPTCNSNNYGVYLDDAVNITINKFSGTGNITTDIYVVPAEHYGDYPSAKMQHFKVAGDNRCYYEYGITYRDTADARSTQCLKYDPASAAYYISQSFFFRADSNTAQTLSAYIKKEAAFNGDVSGAIYFMEEKITGWTDLTPAANDTYEQKSLVAAAGDISEDGVLELRIKARGTVGNVFVDDLATA